MGEKADKVQLVFDYDSKEDVITIEGIRFAGDLFVVQRLDWTAKWKDDRADVYQF